MAGERILIVEDERAVARSLEYALTQEGYSVFWADTGQRAQDLAHTQDPHIILLDLRLPDMSGFDVCRKLRLEGYRQPILILTALDDQLDKVLGLELGADDYVVKPYEMRELIARLRALLRRAYGELALPGRSKHFLFGDIVIDMEQLQVTLRNQPVYLTSTEFRLLVHLTSYPNRPFTRSELMDAVWGYDTSLGSERSVDVHIRHLREKLEDDPAAPRWILTVRGVGYKYQS